MKGDKELNLVEILKNAPKGTKLYSPIFGECELIRVENDGIQVRASTSGYYTFFEKGNYFKKCGECLLFPSKDNRDWSTFNFQVEKRGFKVGDHVKDKETGEMWFLKSKTQDGKTFFAKRIRLSSEVEPDATYISEDEFAQYEKVDKFDPCCLEPFDRVLVRDMEYGEWCATLFSHLNSGCRYPYVAGGKANYDKFKFCIPYNDETKHLVGTSKVEPRFYIVYLAKEDEEETR